MTHFIENIGGDGEIAVGDALTELAQLPSESVDCVVTSPPYYGLRNYEMEKQIGLEESLQDYIDSMVEVFQEIRRVLTSEGTVWLNIGDCYVGGKKGKGSKDGLLGLKQKDIMGVPWRLAFALQKDGWILRQEIIWDKTNAMPENVKDRCSKSHEYIFLLTKSKDYYFDADAIKEERSESSIARDRRGRSSESKYADGFVGQTEQGISAPRTNDEDRAVATKRNKRSVWSVSTKHFKGAHFATFPHDLIEPCILAGCPIDGVVLDPFAGIGTTAGVAQALGRTYIMIELNGEYAKMIPSRIEDVLRRYET